MTTTKVDQVDIERSEQEQRDFLRLALCIVRLFAPSRLTVVPSNNGRWACGMSRTHEGMQAFNDYVAGKLDDIDSLPDSSFQPDELQYAPDDVHTYPEIVLFGLLRHEVGHAKRSKYKNIAKGARHAVREGSLPTTLLGGMNSLEDCWMEGLESEDSIEGRRQLDENMLFHFHKAERLIRAGSLPRASQIMFRIILQNMLGRGLITQSQIEELEQNEFCREVVEAFGKIRPHVEQYFKATRDLLIAGTMNPQNYAGVQKLSLELKSRSLVHKVHYPPVQDASDQYTVDEVLLYKRYIPQLRSFTRGQFIAMWNAVVNNKSRHGIEVLLMPDIERILRDLKILIVTADTFRKAYMGYKMGDRTEPMDFVFSLREGCNIVQLYIRSRTGIKEAIRRVVLPKIDDEKQRATVDVAIISQV